MLWPWKCTVCISVMPPTWNRYKTTFSPVYIVSGGMFPNTCPVYTEREDLIDCTILVKLYGISEARNLHWQCNASNRLVTYGFIKFCRISENITSADKKKTAEFRSWSSKWSDLSRVVQSELRSPRVSVKSDFRSESFRSKFGPILFVLDIVIGCS